MTEPWRSCRAGLAQWFPGSSWSMQCLPLACPLGGHALSIWRRLLPSKPSRLLTSLPYLLAVTCPTDLLCIVNLAAHTAMQKQPHTPLGLGWKMHHMLPSELLCQEQHTDVVRWPAGCRLGTCQRGRAPGLWRLYWLRPQLHIRAGRGRLVCSSGACQKVSSLLCTTCPSSPQPTSGGHYQLCCMPIRQAHQVAPTL